MDTIGDLMDAARAATGLHDFGDDTFRAGLTHLLESIEAEARLTAPGAARLRRKLIGFLVNRLEVEEWYRRYPEIDGEEVTAPVVVLGLPRTGSTALGNLLAADPRARTLRMWEADRPCPPPELATQAEDARIVLTQTGLDEQDRLVPELKTMVPLYATAFAECERLMALAFTCQMFNAWANVPSYNEWFYGGGADLEATYRYELRVLKLLQWRCPPTRWRLKCPTHAMFVEAFDRVFPDARYVMTHRDLGKVIPSVAHMYEVLRRLFSEPVPPVELGRLRTDVARLTVERTVAFRDAGAGHRFYDLNFREVQADPTGCLAPLYEWLGERLTDEVESAMRSWTVTHPRGEHGHHTYRAGDYGVDLRAVREEFSSYTERFHVPVEV